MKLVINSFLILLLLACMSYALDIEDRALEKQIKNSGKYRWGEASDTDPEKAKEVAVRALCQNISVAITATSDRTVSETESDFQDSTIIVTQTYSALNLQNLGSLVFREKDLTRAIAYIDTASLSISFETSKQKVRDMVKLALQAESENRIGDALKQFYWAYLLTHSYIGKLDLGLYGIGISNARMAIERKMTQIATNLNVKADPCIRSAGSSTTTLAFNYNGNAVQNIDFSYYCGEGDDQICISNGEKAYITIYKELTQRRVPLPLRIEYVYAGEMRSQPEILNLYKIFKGKCIDLFVDVELIAPWINDERLQPEKTKLAVQVIKSLPKPASCDWSISIRVLADIKDKQEFQEELTKLKDTGQFYTASDVSQLSSKDRHYLALYCDLDVTALLFHDGLKYKNVRTGREYGDYKDVLPAEGVVSATWIGEVIK